MSEHAEYTSEQQPHLVATGAPDIAFRLFHDATDFAAIVAVRHACQEQDQIDGATIPTAETMGHIYRALMSDASDCLLATFEGAVVACALVESWTEVSGSGALEVYYHQGWVAPEWRRRGIGRTLLGWAEQRSRQAHTQRALDRAATLAVTCAATVPDARRLILRAGYERVYTLSEMRHELGDIPLLRPLPNGLTLRPFQPDQPDAAPQIYAAYKDAWRGLWGETIATDRDYDTFLADNIQSPLFDPTLWQVAWDGDEAAGVVIAVLDRAVGKVREVAVRKRWQRQGVGASLLTGAMRRLRERGASHLQLFTDAANPVGAKTLYQQLGFRDAQQFEFYRKPF